MAIPLCRAIAREQKALGELDITRSRRPDNILGKP